ncbi:disease resistance protein Roq1-like [Argentina anserina]|uniref:disease resistance protein Roq1-like n=1 Tax=Argentina anserina TaxID=57926 RepID=UPI0021767FF8|nr:disease resistance protein Roq1-like [Potentilla anserina]
MDSIASSSSTTTHQSWTYDVFLSFRGDDTRNNFVGHLHSNLVRKGFKTFLDDDGLRRGLDISSELYEAIEDSKVSIVVFSHNYAFSKWCLDELVAILRCKESKQQTVYPIFYKVDPSDVRHQTGSFGKALARHECKFKDRLDKVVRWREALTKAANLSGLHFSDGNESKFIDAILEEVSGQLLNRTCLNVAKYPVGIESRAEDVLKLQGIGGNGVQMVGIWGVGGIGKTTLAKAVYNSVAYQFEGSFFLANVREESMKSGGFVHLQKLIFTEVLGWKPTYSSVDRGIALMKLFMSNRRVLLILDDVNHLSQLDHLVGNPTWFGSGSRIIITTRDKHCLTGFDANEIYKVEELSHHEALELFNFNAFQDHRHGEDYVELVKNVLHYAQGLPLALEVLAVNLRGRDANQWKYALDSYRSLPKQEIGEVLKISYHALEHSMKEVFLHIACFFKGKSKHYVTDVLKACNLNPDYAIDLLEEKALIVVTEEDRIQMHDLLEEMGREIVFQESPKEPGQRSRLWRFEDVYDLFVKNTGSDKVQGIVVTNWNDSGEKIRLSSESFSTLKNLQVFIICGNIFTGDHVNYLSNDLRVLDWFYCPLLSFPYDFNPKKLVLLNLPSSQTSPVGELAKIMQNLKSINLSYCYGLIKLPDFSRFPKLVDLNLSGCKNLVEVDPSIGFSKNLVTLNLGFCEKLLKFEIIEEMKSLKCLDLRGTAIQEISSSIRYLVGLEQLTLRECAKLTSVDCSIFELQHLWHLDLFWCDSLVTFPTRSGSSSTDSSLREKHYDPLFVSLDSCTNLQEILEFPREIDYLNARCCRALKQVSALSKILEGKKSKMIRRLNLYDCKVLCYNLAQMKKNHLRDDSAETALLSIFLSCHQSEFEVFYPAKHGVPEWFSCRNDVNRGGCLAWSAYKFKFELSRHFNCENKGLAFFAKTYKKTFSKGPYIKYCTISITGISIMDPSKKTEDSRRRLSSGHVWLYYIPFHTIIRRLRENGLPLPTMCLVEFEFENDWGGAATGWCGVHVVMPADEDGITIHQVNNADCTSEGDDGLMALSCFTPQHAGASSPSAKLIQSDALLVVLKRLGKLEVEYVSVGMIEDSSIAAFTNKGNEDSNRFQYHWIDLTGFWVGGHPSIMNAKSGLWKTFEVLIYCNCSTATFLVFHFTKNLGNV